MAHRFFDHAMAIFKRTGKHIEATTNYRPLGIPRRYLCAATYTTGSSARYLIRELTSPLTGPDLKEAVIELFLEDLESSAITKKKEGPETERAKKERRLLYLSGKLESLVIDELKQEELGKK